MPDETGLRGLLMSARSAFGMPKKGADVNLEDPKKKKKSFMDRFVDSRKMDENTRKGVEQLRSLATPKKR